MWYNFSKRIPLGANKPQSSLMLSINTLNKEAVCKGKMWCTSMFKLTELIFVAVPFLLSFSTSSVLQQPFWCNRTLYKTHG